MLECLCTTENQAMDPPVPGLQVSQRVKGRVGQPHVVKVTFGCTRVALVRCQPQDNLGLLSP